MSPAKRWPIISLSVVAMFGGGNNEAGEISVSFRLGNISLEPGEIAGLFFTFPQIIFHEAKIKYKEDSLLERFLNFRVAIQNYPDLETLKRSIIQDIEVEIENENDDLTKKSLSEIIDFIENPKKLSFSASPSKPYPLGMIMRIQEPKDIIKLLNIKIRS